MNRRDWLKAGVMAAGTPFFGAVPAAGEEGNGTGNAKPALTLWQLPNQTTSQMMSYILLTGDDKLIVIDGGTKDDADYLVKQIKQIHPDGRVDYWLFSHIHCDHAWALAEILTRGTDGLKIGQVYCDFPAADWVKVHESVSYDVSVEILGAFAKYADAVKMPKNQPLQLGNVQITALNDLGDLNMDEPAMTVNDTSILYQVKTPETTLLFLGDLYIHGQKSLLEKIPHETFKADVVQMAHHGQNGVTRDFYNLVRPSVCLWCAPDWLWDNNPPGSGSDTGPWKTIQTRAWMNEMGVKRHYIIKDGLVKLEFA